MRHEAPMNSKIVIRGNAFLSSFATASFIPSPSLCNFVAFEAGPLHYDLGIFSGYSALPGGVEKIDLPHLLGSDLCRCGTPLLHKSIHIWLLVVSGAWDHPNCQKNAPRICAPSCGFPPILGVASRIAPRIRFSYGIGCECNSKSCWENHRKFRELLREWGFHFESVFFIQAPLKSMSPRGTPTQDEKGEWRFGEASVNPLVQGRLKAE